MNKVVITVFVAALFTTTVKAQTLSGDMMVGGSINVSSVTRQSGSVNDMSSFTFSPSFGYFISDHLAIGTSLTLGTSRSGTGAAKTTSSSFGFGPFARYYKFTSNENFAFFGQAGINIFTGRTDPAAGSVTKSSAVSFSIAPGAAYFFNNHWAMELSITGFAISSSDPDTSNDNDKVTRVDFDLRSFSPALGIRYHL
jgi:hypothetical protein